MYIKAAVRHAREIFPFCLQAIQVHMSAILTQF